MGLIAIENMEFYAYHGCFREERKIGTQFIVDIFLKIPTQEAEKTDNLRKTVDYQKVYLLIKKEMEQPSNLLEHVGRRIMDAVMQAFPTVEEVKVKLSNMNPPLGGKMDRVSVTLKNC